VVKPNKMADSAKRRNGSVSKSQRDMCNICNKEVKSKDKALACEICELWYHIDCHGKVPLALYEILIGDGANLHWFCDNCNGAVAKIYKMVCSVQTRQDVIEGKVDKISDSLDDLKTNFNSSIDSRLDEREDRIRREQNLILFNVDESDMKDEELVREVCTDVLKVDAPLISRCRRLGKKTDKPRPLCVVIPDRETRLDILKNSNALKDSKYEKISISRDYTMEQRETNKILRQELNEKRLADPDTKFVIRRGKVVKWTEPKGPNGASVFQK
jgi:hypothetical protein